MYRWLVPHLVLPLADRLMGRQVWAEVRRLRFLQWRGCDELQARALTRLQPVLRHAAAHVPYYAGRFAEAGLAPESIRALDDLARVPLTSRQALRAATPDRSLAEGVPPARRIAMRTSGSSGTPFAFYADRAGLDAWLGAFIFSSSGRVLPSGIRESRSPALRDRDPTSPISPGSPAGSAGWSSASESWR